MVKIDRLEQMTKCAIYEERDGKWTLPISKYHRSDYVSMNMFISFVLSTIAFFIIAGGYLVYLLDANKDLANISYSSIGVITLVLYITWEILILIITFVYYRKKYHKARKSLRKYYENLKELNKMYSEEKKATMSFSSELNNDTFMTL